MNSITPAALGDHIGQLILVEWTDSRQQIGGWRHWKDLLETEWSPVLCYTAGWLAFVSEDVIVVAQTAAEFSENPQAMGITQITRSTVRGFLPVGPNDLKF